MPFYEYKCNQCGRVESVFFRSFSSVQDPSCPSCGSGDMARLISRPAIIKSAGERLMGVDPERYLSGLDPHDKGSIVRWAKEMGRELDEDMGSEFLEMAERMEAGEEPFEDDLGAGDDFESYL